MPIDLTTVLPSYAVDYVAVFDQNFNQLFTGAKMLKATVKEQARLMEHPIETGATITDHRIILPVEIDLSVILTSSADYQSVYKAIRSYYLNSTLVVIQTRAGIYENQLIQSMPHEEDPAQYDALSIAISLKQVLFVTAQFGIVPRKASNGTTIDRGTQQGAPPAASHTTAADQIFGRFL